MSDGLRDELADWGVVPDPEIEERFRRDMEAIREAERRAWRDASTIFIGHADAIEAGE